MTTSLGRRIARIEAANEAAKPIDLDSLTVEDLLAGRLPRGALEQLVRLSYAEASND